MRILACLPGRKAARTEMDAPQPKVLEFRIPADTRYIAVVRRGVRSLAESAGFARGEVADVEVAVSEAVANSVTHGSPDPSRAAVLVKCEARADALVVEIEDQSGAESLPKTSKRCNARSEQGRGVMMMRALMDVCEDRRTQTGMKVTLAKQKGGV